jgi:hypothetical protein
MLVLVLAFPVLRNSQVLLECLRLLTRYLFQFHYHLYLKDEFNIN